MINSYSLLYVAKGDPSINAGKMVSDDDKFAAYLGNAQFLAVGLQRSGSSLTLFSNEPEYLGDLFKRRFKASPAFSLSTASFDSKVPQGTAFYSAHYKMDAIKCLIEAQDFQPFVFLDLDMLILRPQSWAKEFYLLAAESKTNGAGIITYDISDQVFPVYGDSAISSDIESLTQVTRGALPSWMGGEFLSVVDQSEGLRLLDEIAKVWPRYISTWKQMHHVGDETIVSAAVHLLKNSGSRIDNVNDNTRPLRLKRFWSGRVRHSQTSWIEVVLNTVVLHLPQDKKFITLVFSIFDRYLNMLYPVALWLVLTWIGARRLAVHASNMFSHSPQN